MNISRKISLFLFISAIVFFTILMVKITIPYFSFRYDIDFLLTKQSILHSKIWRYSFYTHISSSIFVLLFGAFQFIQVNSSKTKTLHRTLGKIYILLILFVSAPSGLIMAFYANGGWGAKISFIIISILWWAFTYLAYKKIKHKHIESHKRYMSRSYALTLSAITLRLYVLVLPFILPMSSKTMYVFVAWCSWVPNLLAVELFWLLRKKKNSIK